MLTIYTTENLYSEVANVIGNTGGLKDFVMVQSITESPEGLRGLYIIIEGSEIKWPPDWLNMEPPLLFRPQPFSENTLVAMVFAKLGHFDKAFSHSRNPYVKLIIGHFRSFIEGSPVIYGEDEEDYFYKHNCAIIQHYTGVGQNGRLLDDLYKNAIECAPNEELASYSARHYAVYLSDNGDIDQAVGQLRSCITKTISDEAHFALKFDLINSLSQKINFPYNQVLIEEIKQLIRDTLAYYETTGSNISVAMLLVEASETANISGSYSESLGYINRAIEIYKEEQVPEFLATAFLRKGTLLYTWAQNDNPQFFKGAIETYQEALKFFKKETTPAVFAEIHHNLGVIYSEMPSDIQQKSIWAAVSATSFKESLEFYHQQNLPYEYAMTANNYANALMKYPPSKHGDNFEKAIYYYNQSLEIRSSEAYPLERAHTLLNYLEACWRVNNINNNMERLRYKDMVSKAKEVKTLTDNPELVSQAEQHLENLMELKKSLITG